MAERLRVLVVDDEEGIRLGVARVLEKFVASFPDIAAEISYEVEAAQDGEIAVERLKEAPPDILLLDLKLPGIGGLDVLREAQALEPPVLTVMVTAYASVTTAVEATRGGTFDFLPKPFTPNEIKAVVRRATRDLHPQSPGQEVGRGAAAHALRAHPRAGARAEGAAWGGGRLPVVDPRRRGQRRGDHAPGGHALDCAHPGHAPADFGPARRDPAGGGHEGARIRAGAARRCRARMHGCPASAGRGQGRHPGACGSARSRPARRARRSWKSCSTTC